MNVFESLGILLFSLVRALRELTPEKMHELEILSIKATSLISIVCACTFYIAHTLVWLWDSIWGLHA